MKKSLKTLLSALTLSLTLGLASCGSVSQKYADKVNAAAATTEEKDDYTYEQVMKDLGTPVTDATVAIGSLGKSGIVTWAKGCKSSDDVKAKEDAGKKVEYIAVTFVNGKATAASYSVSEPKEKSK